MPEQQDALVLEIAASGGKEAALILVCGGISGLKGGEYAGSYITMRVRNWFYDSYLKHLKKRHGRRRIERDATRMLYDCNRFLRQYGEEHGIRLGTAMTMLLLYGRRFFGVCGFSSPVRYLLFHTGDCRAYLLGRRCRKLTADDGDEGRGLYRCIGSFPWQGVEKRQGWLKSGEKVLLCSNGFWRTLEEREMLESLGGKGKAWKRHKLTEEQLEKRLHKLGEAGRARGEKDNQAAAIVGTE